MLFRSLIWLRRTLFSYFGSKLTNLLLINAGDEVIWRDRNGDVQKIKAITDVPMYHKVAIKEMPKGTEVVKYGEHIGLAACDIHVGEHVHVHNVQNHRENL